MSKQLSLLQVEPDKLDWENKPEVMKIIAECPMCKGEGCFRKAKNYHGSAKDKYTITQCIRCKGTGRLKADIIIRWTADEQTEEKL